MVQTWRIYSRPPTLAHLCLPCVPQTQPLCLSFFPSIVLVAILLLSTDLSTGHRFPFIFPFLIWAVFSSYHANSRSVFFAFRFLPQSCQVPAVNLDMVVISLLSAPDRPFFSLYVTLPSCLYPSLLLGSHSKVAFPPYLLFLTKGEKKLSDKFLIWFCIRLVLMFVTLTASQFKPQMYKCYFNHET